MKEGLIALAVGSLFILRAVVESVQSGTITWELSLYAGTILFLLIMPTDRFMFSKQWLLVPRGGRITKGREANDRVGDSHLSGAAECAVFG